MKLAVFAVLSGACAGIAHADLLKPNGEFPGGVESVTSEGVTVRAFRATLASTTDAAGLDAAIRAQNFNWGLGGRITGDFRLDQNTAWAQTEPAQNFYGFNFPAVPRPHSGGAAIAIGYVPGFGDPEAVDARWIQLIRTNSPSTFGTTYGVGLVDDVGYTWYLDNGWPNQATPPSDPFYGGDDNNNATGYAGNGRGILDASSRGLAGGVWWEAWAFMSTRDARGNITIYDGVHWGFEMTAVPTPGALALFTLSGLVAYRRRRVAQSSGL